jgi:hypothetical protein
MFDLLTTPKFIMILKNILIFGSGIIFGVIGVSIISAYYMLNSERNYNLKEDIQFMINEEANKVYWNPPRNFIDALETWYTILLFHFSKSNKTVFKRNTKCAKIIFLSALGLFLALIIGGCWLSLDIEYLDD